MTWKQVSSDWISFHQIMMWERLPPQAIGRDDDSRCGSHDLLKLTEHTSWRARHDVLAVVKLAYVLAHVGAPDAGVTLHVHVVSQSEQHLRTRANSQSENSTYDHR